MQENIQKKNRILYGLRWLILIVLLVLAIRSGCTPCHALNLGAELEAYAIRGDNVICGKLIADGADVNFNGGAGAIHSAIKQGNIELFKILLDNGADVNAANKDGNFAIYYAVRLEDVEKSLAIVKLLIKSEADFTILYNRITPHDVKNLEVLKYLLDNEFINVNFQDALDKTAVMRFADEGDVARFKLILQYNPDLELKNSFGLNTLDYIESSQNIRIEEIREIYKMSLEE